MHLCNGWWLPDGDTYFAQYTVGGKGFQMDHLEAAYKHVKAWGAAVDVGAHVGFWTRSMGRKFDSVYAFEANPDTFECLARNCQTDNVATHHYALGDTNGVYTPATDATRRGNSGSNFIRPGKGSLEMITLDSYPLAACDLLKIDVEGFEFQVLMGAAHTIQKFWPVISMETDKPFARSRFGVPDDAAEKQLLSWGYTVAEHIRPDKVFVR